MTMTRGQGPPRFPTLPAEDLYIDAVPAPFQTQQWFLCHASSAQLSVGGCVDLLAS